MSTIYAALDHTVLVGAGAGDDWQVTERLVDLDPQCVVADRGAADRVFVGTFDAGVHRSTDGGDTFERVGADVVHDRVMAAAINPQDDDEVWVGTEPSSVFVSRDGGDTWREKAGLTDLPSAADWYFPPRPDTHHVRWLEVDPHDPDRLYVGIEAGAFVRSTDGGDSWDDRPPGARLDNHSLATHRDAPGKVFAAAGDGYAESTDSAQSWEHPQSGLDHRYCWSVVPDPRDPDTVVLSAARGPRAAHRQPAESFVYRREGSDPWTLAMDGLPDPEGSLRAVMAPGTEAGEIWLLSNHGLFVTADAGRSWTQTAVPWHDRYTDRRPRGLTVV